MCYLINVYCGGWTLRVSAVRYTFFQTVFQNIRRYLVDEALAKDNIVLDMTHWTDTVSMERPRQRNGYVLMCVVNYYLLFCNRFGTLQSYRFDCGMFLCENVRFLCAQVDVNLRDCYSQGDMPYMRKRAILDCVRNFRL